MRPSVKRMRQVTRLRSGLAILLTAMLMAACANAELSSDYHADGSATHTIEVQVDRSALQLVPAELANLNPARIVQAARERGFQAEEIGTSERVGFRIWHDVADSSDIGATFGDILTAVLDQRVAGADQFVSGSFTHVDERYTLDMTISSDAVLRSLGGDAASNLPSQASLLVDFVYIATFPGEVKETNGTKVGDDQVRWELPLTGTTQLTAVAGEDSGDSALLMYILLGVILLLVGLVVAYLVLRRRTRPVPALATAGPPPMNDPVIIPPGDESLEPAEVAPSVADTSIEGSPGDVHGMDDGERPDEQETRRLP